MASESLWDGEVRTLHVLPLLDAASDQVILSTEEGLLGFEIGGGLDMTFGWTELYVGPGQSPALSLAPELGGGARAIMAISPINNWVWLRSRQADDYEESALLDTEARGGTTADLVGDGKDDVLLLSGSGLTYIQDSSSVTGCAAAIDVGVHFDVITAGDHDGDGRAEVAGANEDRVWVYTAQ